MFIISFSHSTVQNIFIWWGNEPSNRSTGSAIESKPQRIGLLLDALWRLSQIPLRYRTWTDASPWGQMRSGKPFEIVGYPWGCTMPSSIYFLRTLSCVLSLSEHGVIQQYRIYLNKYPPSEGSVGSVGEGQENWLAKKGHFLNSRACFRSVSWGDWYVQVLEKVENGRGPTLRGCEKS